MRQPWLPDFLMIALKAFEKYDDFSAIHLKHKIFKSKKGVFYGKFHN